jgi:hypothetical protein
VAAASGGADLETVIAGWASLEMLLVMEPGSFTPAEGGMKDAEWASLVGRCRLTLSYETHMGSAWDLAPETII